MSLFFTQLFFRGLNIITDIYIAFTIHFPSRTLIMKLVQERHSSNKKEN